MENIGFRIKQVRTLIGMSQQALADEVKLTKQAISNIENQKCAPSITLLSKLLIDYNVNLNFIIAGKGSIFIDDEKTAASIRKTIISEVEKMLDARGIL